MVRYRVEYPATHAAAPQMLSFEAPDLHTALTVADMLVTRGPATIYAGERQLAQVERRGQGHRSFWYVAGGDAGAAAG